MRFFTWLFGQAPTEADPPPTITIRVGMQTEPTIFEPDWDALIRADEIENQARQRAKREAAKLAALDTPGLVLTGSASDLGDAFCLLEYRDAAGADSRRRVSMRSLAESAGHIYLNAFCFERRAMRQFRLDRITAMISEDGEVFDPVDYFALHGVELRPQTADETRATGDAGRALIAMRPGLAMITAVARADRHLHRGEIDAAQLYAERDLIALRREGVLTVEPSMDVLNAMNREIAFMRPMAPTLKAQALRICDWTEARLGRLRRSILETVVADGRILPSELNMVAELDRILHESPHARRAEVAIGFDEAMAQDIVRRQH